MRTILMKKIRTRVSLLKVLASAYFFELLKNVAFDLASTQMLRETRTPTGWEGSNNAILLGSNSASRLDRRIGGPDRAAAGFRAGGAALRLGRRRHASADRMGGVLRGACERMQGCAQRAAQRHAHGAAVARAGAGQSIGQRQHQADDRPRALRRGREMGLSGRRLRRLRGLRAAQAANADGRRLAA